MIFLVDHEADGFMRPESDAARTIDLKGRAAPITVYPLADLTDEAAEARG